MSTTRTVIAALLAFAALMAVTSARADDPKSGVLTKEKKLEDIRRRIRLEERDIEKMSRKERSILGELDRLDRTIHRKATELRKIRAELEKVRSGIASRDGKIKELAREVEELSGKLSRRLEAMYKMKRGEAVRLIFSSATPASLGRRHKYLAVIMESDSRLIAECDEKITRLRKEKASLTELEAKKETLASTIARNRNEAVALKRKRKVFLANIQREKGRRESVVEELRDAARELARLLDDLRGDEYVPGEAGGFAAMKGSLKMPVKGDIISNYGRHVHPRFKTVTFNNGILIEASAGEPARSVFEGRVAYVGWLKGYGQIMIVDHGGGYYTLFAHLSRILKEKGDKVEKGEEVALVGDTGPAGTSGLYFEIREKGVPKDPVPWFASRR